MTLFYPDIYSGQAGMSFKGTLIAVVKATQGTGYTNPDYVKAKARAAANGTYFCAYHFLTQGNGSAQADHAFSVVGAGTSLMLDWESTPGSNPGVADAQAFVTRYKALGGTVVLNYLPHWYWQQIGSPSLKWFANQGMVLVASNYQGYTDNGPGWTGYGGMVVAAWQYSATATFNGFHPVDFNAYKGTVAEFTALTKGATMKPENLVLSAGDSGPAVVYAQQRLNVHGAKLSVDGDFGALTTQAVRTFQTASHLTVDGVIGPATWKALDASAPNGPVVPPANGAFPAPTGFAEAGRLTSIGVKWSPVVVAGKPVASYTVQCWQMNGVQVGANKVVTVNNARFDNLHPGWQYRFRVWANGGPVAPTGSEVTLTA
jgi:GH25 family lysozyme M1 (1,4-beta-N-acetylmuramidase)